MASRQLQGAIFKYQGTSYMVLPDNQWDSDNLLVKSIDPARKTATLPRTLIQESVSGQHNGTEQTK